MKKYLLTLVCALLMGVSANAQNKKQVVDPANFKVTVNQMNPLKYPTRIITDNSYGLEIKGDSVDVCLPYMGEVYSGAYNPDGLRFKEPVKNLQISQKENKKGETITNLSFEVRHNVNYRFHVEVWDKDVSIIDVTPSNANAISYNGDVEK